MSVETPQAKAARIAEQGRARFERNIARERWMIRQPGDEHAVEVVFNPGQSITDVLNNWPRYAHCSVLPL
ncbi:MAG: hypothetical protein ABI972_31110 [Acidobacteriota bacterium]